MVQKIFYLPLSSNEIFTDMQGIDNVVAVSTDAGGAKFTVHFSDAMDIPYAIANKFRPGKDRRSE